MFYIYNPITNTEEKVSKIEKHHLHRNTKLPLISEEESVQSVVETPVKKA
jgi:hypothetical protein